MAQDASKDRYKVWLAVGLPILALVYVHLAAHIMMFRIEYGMPAAKILKLYGKPDKTESTMLFCDGIFEWHGNCPASQHGLYHFYKKGIDRWVVVGYDAKRLVAFKTLGDL